MFSQDLKKSLPAECRSSFTGMSVVTVQNVKKIKVIFLFFFQIMEDQKDDTCGFPGFEDFFFFLQKNLKNKDKSYKMFCRSTTSSLSRLIDKRQLLGSFRLMSGGALAAYVKSQLRTEYSFKCCVVVVACAYR